MKFQMQNDVPRRLGDDAIVVDHQAALKASRILINAICADPHEVSMADIAPALESALRAYGLPPDFPSQVLVQELNQGTTGGCQ